MNRKWLGVGISLIVVFLPVSEVNATLITTEGKPVLVLTDTATQSVIFYDSFETYQNFVVDDFQLWTTFDGDGGQTKGMEGFDWPNESYTGSFMVFNPTRTNPPLNTTYYPYDGLKYMTCWDTVTPMAPNDDWLFTPQLAAGTFYSMSLWARSLNDQYGLEDFEIGVSTNYTDPSSFTILQVYNDVPVNWTKYTINLSSYSGQGIYIGIHVVSYDVFAFGLDDFIVTGTMGPCDDTPPVTVCILEGAFDGTVYTSDVLVTLTATDNWSGVNITKYKLDAGSWSDYAEAFTVTEDGSHTVFFYSIDNAGNQETEKKSIFSIQHDILIEITGGFGISATITNIGKTNLTNLDWMITHIGKLIFMGKNKSGILMSLAAGDSITIKDVVIGFGPLLMTVQVSDEEKTASGFLLLFFVLGVK